MNTPSSNSSMDGSKMKLVHFSNEFPNDDLKDLYRRLHAHSKDKKHLILAAFLDNATSAIKEEVQKLPRSLKDLIPPFETILNFVEHPSLRQGPLGGSVEGILLCVLEIATFVGFYEESTEEYIFDASNACLTGMGIGLLASSAISMSQSMSDIPLAGAEAVRIAFRLGVLVDEVSQNLEPREEGTSPDTWAIVVTGVTESGVQKELNTIQSKGNIPESGKIFISAAGESSVTVSGPPSRLKALFRNYGYFRDSKFIQLPVYGGLCHAGHVYSEKHVRDITRTPALEALDAVRRPRIPVLSTGTGKRYPASSCTDLLEQLVFELLTQQIRWDNVIAGAIEHIKYMGVNDCNVFVFRPSLPVQDLVTALKKVKDLSVSLEELVPWISAKTKESQSARGPMQSKIAIVGQACRFPGGATDTDKFWELLEQGRDVHKKIPADRFDVDSHTDVTGKKVNTSGTPYGCFIDEPGLFDAPFFNMSPREAAQTDPMQRLALVTAYEALEKAGYVQNRTSATKLPRVGVFYGQASDDYREVNSNQEISTYFIPGGCRAFGPGRINYFFKFAGPSFNCDTACSSSLATIQIACTTLWAGDADTVVAGGLNVLTNSDAFAGLSNGHFLSKTGGCKTWDTGADGYCRGDGVGSIVLKRLEDAEADHDNILGVILSGATNHSAEAVSITHPHAGAQSYLYEQVVRRAGVNPLDVDYVEFHGTGTQAGDSVEMQSITNVFAPIVGRRNKKQPLHIGAVKSNVGHGEAAAGVTALIKVLCMLKENAIPPHVGIKTEINPGFPKDMDKRNIHIPFEKTPWPRVAGKKRTAVVNNFSAAGGNTTILLEDGPIREITEVDPRSTHVVTVSAKSKVSLKGNINRILKYLDTHPDTSVADLSYTTSARRVHHNHRFALPVSDVAQVEKGLNDCLEKLDPLKAVSTLGPPPVAFAFTGQGASFNPAHLQLFHDASYFRNQIQHLDNIAQMQGFPSFLPAFDGTAPEDATFSPVVSQLAHVCGEIALAKFWATLGIKPSVVVGHSLGEYAALHVAGVLSASDTVFLVGSRARLLEKTCKPGSHVMMSVRGSVSEIQDSASPKDYEIACINGPKDTVLSGTREQMNSVAESLQADGLKSMKLDIPYAFHSAQVDPLLKEFEKIAKEGVIFKAPMLPIISPLLGKVIFDEKTVNATYLRRATRETVNFVGALDFAQQLTTTDEKTAWIEIGPHPVCTSFVKNSVPSVNIAVPSMKKNEDNWVTLANSMATLHCGGFELDWNEFNRPFESSLRLLDLPTYAWNDKNYWIPYNGDWALTKGNNFYTPKEEPKAISAPEPVSNLSTSTVQQIIEEDWTENTARVVMQSDLMKPDFYAAANGHFMNGCGVVTSSIHADIAYTLGKYIYEQLRPGTKKVDMNVSNLVVTKGLIAHKNTKKPQRIQVTATADLTENKVDLRWHNVNDDGSLDEEEEGFANAIVYYGDSEAWLNDWARSEHLVQGRIESLARAAQEGTVNKVNRNMAYKLFANLVDYAEKYRGMHSVTLNDYEAYADVVLTKEKSGTWTIPPYYIDSVAHLAGFILNGSDAVDNKNNFFVTPGWSSMRFAKPLEAGGKYQSYVKMLPTPEDPGIYLGDVYIMQDKHIVGMVGGIKFRQYPRILINKFFSAPDGGSSKGESKGASAAKKPDPPKKAPEPKKAPAPKAAEAPKVEEKPAEPAQKTAEKPAEKSTETPAEKGAGGAPKKGHNALEDVDSDSVAAKAIKLIENEAALEDSDMTDDATFASLGIDSLMSLVIAEKFREELQVTVGGSLFLEYPTVGDLKSWLTEYYA
ncbi:MAG: hypothetical protein L6R39_003393 [Caloplaca ligustica]|nr:MAG: hypothetical protein L6R39_003393 [Caloplaca ligustica]